MVLGLETLDFNFAKENLNVRCARIHPVHLLRVSLLRVLESNFPGGALQNSTDMRIPTP